MELVSILESQVDSLVAEIKLMRKENAKLREDATGGSTDLQAENGRLKRELVTVQQQKAATLQRMEGILARTQDVVQDKR